MMRPIRLLAILAFAATSTLLTAEFSKAQCPVTIQTVTATDVTCNGASNGTITITVTGGSPDYTYQLFNGPLFISSGPQPTTTYTFTGLGAGISNYQIIVVGQDGLGGSCPAAISFATVNDPAPFNIVVTATNETCPTSNDGGASVSVSGGLAPYTYSWLPFASATSAVSGLNSGTYNVTVSDANGCSEVVPYTITQSPDWAATLTGTNPTCNGGLNGSIATTGLVGGTAPYTFLWSSGQTTQNISGVGSGTYILTITDATGCTYTPPGVILSEPAPIAITGIVTPVSCAGANNGAVTISFTGGVGPFTFNWQPGNIVTQNITGRAPGSYTVTVTDSNGCQGTANFVINQLAPIVITPTTVDATCNGICDGQASVAVVGGTGPYSYTWTPNVGSGSSVSGLCGGNYQVLVTDANGCTNTAQFTISDIQIQLSVTATDMSCNGTCDGTATATVTGANAPFSYLWQETGGTGLSESGLCAGTYTFVVTDNIGCSQQQTVTINEPNPIVITLAVTDVTCNGANDGSIDMTVTGGTAPYTYVWSPGGETTEDISNLPAGDYSVVVTDANGCTASEITLGGSFAGGTLALPDGNGVSYNTSVAITGFPAGGTITTGTDLQNICINMEQSYLGDLEMTLTCPNGQTVVLKEYPGGTGTYLGGANDAGSNGIPGTGAEYCFSETATFGTILQENALGNWVTAGNLPNNSMTPGTYTPTQSFNGFIGCPLNGNWTITVTDNLSIDDGFIFDWSLTFGGSGGSDLIATVNEPAPIAITTTPTDATCGLCNGTITAAASNGTAPYSYLWDDPAGQTTATATGLCAGTYNVIVTDANGCTNAAAGTIVDTPNLTVTVSSTDASCNGVCDGTATANVQTGTAPFTYLWNDPAGQTTATATGLCAGNYTVTVTDANNCTFSVSGNITQPTPIVITFSNIIDLECSGTCIGEATATVTGGNGPYTVSWNDPANQTTLTATGLCASTYIITATDADGCTQTGSVVIAGPNGLTSSITTQVNPTCNGNCDGTATVTASGGTAPYTYLWNDPLAQTTATATGLCAGTFEVTVTDANGCVSVSSVTIAQPITLTATTTANDPDCFGICDATSTVFTTGGTFPYSYQWNDPNGQTTITAVNLCPGIYNVDVTDASGCVTTATVNIFQPLEITANSAVVNANCGQCDGQATVSPTGGVQPYTYLWGDGQTTATITGLCAGVYNVDVIDQFGCVQNFIIPVNNDGGATSATVVVADASCFGTCDGEGTVTPLGGTAPYTYLWVPGGQTTTSVTGLCAGTYNVQIIDDLGCIFIQPVVIAEPAQIVPAYTSTPATCGNSDGAITVNPSGGDGGPYTYSWVPNVSSAATAANLVAGTYTVTVTDGNGCSAIIVIPVNNIDGPLLTGVSTEASCNGTCDGTATVTITGGLAPYSILWDDPAGQTTGTATGLCAGLVSASITDANGCVTVTQVTVTEPTEISVSLPLITNASCAEVCDGAVTVVASGGTLPYTVSWSPSGGSLATATGLCAGDYTATITDANGCTATVSVTIDEPTPIVIATTTVDASCFGVCDGEASANATGGAGGFTYLWDDPAAATSANVTGLCAGTYTVTATDAAGCTNTSQITISEPAAIVITASAQGVSCTGDCDGEAYASATGGTGPYSYQWTDLAATQNDTVTDLCPGIYNVIVTDANGCTSTTAVIVTEPLPLVVAGVATNITCGGECDGIATAIAQGGTSPYTYLWNDANAQTTAAAAGLCAGTYTVVVTDANGCTATTSVDIIEPPVLDATVSVVNPSCGGECDGSATVTITGGTAPYAILWSNFGLGSSITNLCAGLYSVTVTDANLCTVTVDINLTEPPVLNANITATSQIQCSGSCNGQATVTGSGGTPPFTYLWADGQTSATATGLCEGTYDVTITDGIGCTANASVTINDDNVLVATVPIFTSVSCNGDCDGTASVFATGGVGPYQYFWNDQFNQTTQVVAGLCPGNYTVTVVDAQAPACSTQATVVITEPALLTSSATAVDETCGGACDGTATAIPNGGTPPYTFLWNDPSNQTGATATALCVGTYTVTVIDANECVTQSSVTVLGPPALVSNATTSASTCSNVANGSINLTAAGGVGTYSFQWNPTGATTEDLNNAFFGTYAVTITDATGCSIVDSYSIGTLVNIEAQAGDDLNLCVGSSLTLNGAGGGTYQWSPAESLSDATAANPTANPIVNTTYLLTVSIGNCVDTDSVLVTMYNVPPVDGGEDVTIPTGGTIGLNALGVVTEWTYTWTPGDALSDSTITNPFASPLETTMYYVTVTDENGCTNMDSVLVEVVPGIKFPDGVTPNGDGINDTWIIDNIELFSDAVVEIYNRWGQMLWQSAEGYPIPWDGRYDGNDLPVGTYYYVIRSENFEQPFTGPITIVR